MTVRLRGCPAFLGGWLLYASRPAQRRGLGGPTGVIEGVARQRMGRTSSVSVLKVAGRVLVVGSTEEQVTLLAEVEDDELRTAMAAAAPQVHSGEDAEPRRAALPARSGSRSEEHTSELQSRQYL